MYIMQWWGIHLAIIKYEYMQMWITYHLDKKKQKIVIESLKM